MDVCSLIKQRLEELKLPQRDLAAAARVTESYVSQLLSRKKSPPAPSRTDIYDKMGRFLKLPDGQLSKLADLQRREELKKNVLDRPRPLLGEVRELILRKCEPGKRKPIGEIFENQPLGELERLVTQKLLDVVKKVTREELESEHWLHLVARISGQSYEQMRVRILEFLEADVFNASGENCVSFLDPLIESWDIDLKTFGMEIVLNRSLGPGYPKRFEFVETEPEQPLDARSGLREFLGNSSLSGGISEEEIEFLKSLRFKGRKPTPLYFYRELQSIRDPLHFSEGAIAPRRGPWEGDVTGKQIPGETRKKASQRLTERRK